MAAADNLRRNRRDLGRRLAEPEDHFGKALAERAVVVDLRKPKVLKGLVPKRCKNAVERGGGVGSSFSHLVEKVPQCLCVIQEHCRIMMDWTTGRCAHLR